MSTKPFHLTLHQQNLLADIQSARRKARELQQAAAFWERKRDEHVLTMIDSGLNASELARILGPNVEPSTVQNWKRRAQKAP